MALIDKDQIRAEIERLKKRAEAERVLHPKTILAAKDVLLIKDYDSLLAFLDSLPEQPVEGLEEAAVAYSKQVSDGHNFRDLRVGFIAGAEWDRAKMLEGAIHCVVQDDLSSYGVSYNIPRIYIGAIALKPRGIGVGDKVKIIIVKEDEK